MTTYSEILSELKASVTNAKDYIPRLCQAAREEDPTLNEQTIRDRVKTDCIALGLSADYVRDCIPKEFKDKIKAKAGKKGKEKQEEEKEKIALLADGTPDPAQTKRAENNPEHPKKQDSKTSESQDEKHEDPKDIQIQFLQDEIERLKAIPRENLIQTAEQLSKPANQLTEEQARDMTMEVVKQAGLAVPETNLESVTDWLKKQADGIHSFYYDTYGIDLFRNRELSQLKNSGVKVFKRLYFEV